MLWTPEQQDAARALGWELIETADNGTSKFVLRIFGVGPYTNLSAQRAVMQGARNGNTLCSAALKAIALSVAGETKRKKR